MAALKDVYREYFKIGVACEKINERFKSHELGNPAKEKLIEEQFNSITFGNELKPMYNMGFASSEATEEYLPFVIHPNAKAMLDWAMEHHMPVRGHVLVWHSQCPREVFCKGYRLVTIPTDPEILKKNPMMKHFEKLDPACYVDRDTMLKRLKSYIYSCMEYMYANGYADVIYAWDVVNEAIETADQTPTGLRDSYWYQVIGDDFIYYAFRYARDAAETYARKYASQYGIDPDNEKAVHAKCPKLFYNDYNEWIADKKEAIIAILNRKTQEHGSVFSEGLIDGIGMQGHLSDNNDLDEYLGALREYGKLVDEVQITELDVKCTCTNANAEYYQACFYKKLFEGILAAKKDGINVTAVTLWGLTDDNSWIRGADPLLFHGDLTCKKSYDALIYAVTGGDLGEPVKIICNLADRLYDFSGYEKKEDIPLEEWGFRFRGFGDMTVQKEVTHSEGYALLNERRFGDWCGITYDASDFIGQTVEIGAWLKTEAQEVILVGDYGGNFRSVFTQICGKGEWVYAHGQAKIPANLHSAVFVFQVKDKEGTISPLYIDDITVKLVGQEESFEEATNIASIRGAGHLPFISVVDYESRDGAGHSLLVIRQEKDATVKLNISSYIGHKAHVTVYVKTDDKEIRMGLDGATPAELVRVPALAGGWTEISASVELPCELHTAEIYLETDGRADFYVDDIFVSMEK